MEKKVLVESSDASELKGKALNLEKEAFDIIRRLSRHDLKKLSKHCLTCTMDSICPYQNCLQGKRLILQSTLRPSKSLPTIHLSEIVQEEAQIKVTKAGNTSKFLFRRPKSISCCLTALEDEDDETTEKCRDE